MRQHDCMSLPQSLHDWIRTLPLRAHCKETVMPYRLLCRALMGADSFARSRVALLRSRAGKCVPRARSVAHIAPRQGARRVACALPPAAAATVAGHAGAGGPRALRVHIVASGEQSDMCQSAGHGTWIDQVCALLVGAQ